MSTPLYIAATGNAGPTNGGIINSIVITANATAGTAVFRSNGSGGSIFLELAAAVSTSFGVNFIDLAYGGQLHVTLTGAGVTVMVEQT